MRDRNYVLDLKVCYIPFNLWSILDWYRLGVSLFLVFILVASLMAPRWLAAQVYLPRLNWWHPETWLQQYLHGKW